MPFTDDTPDSERGTAQLGWPATPPRSCNVIRGAPTPKPFFLRKLFFGSHVVPTTYRCFAGAEDSEEGHGVQPRGAADRLQAGVTRLLH